MHSILSKLFAKKGIADVKELDPEEKATFEAWDKVLSKEELTISDIKEFCQSQCDVIEGKWKSYDIKNSKKAEMIPYHTVYKTILTAIGSPRAAREQLEAQLNQLLLK